MSDALVSTPVAGVAAIAAATLIIVASRQVKNSGRDELVPLMGVMGAFIFAAQMINFSIPGTGSSGHVVGGILLAAVLGPWAAFLTLTSVIIIQCLIFADGGLLALGCNILNMAAASTLIGYSAIYKPIVSHSFKPWRIMLASIAASVIALEIGALGVCGETLASDITMLPAGTFIEFMLPIHFAIGTIEGLATGATLIFVARYRPQTLYGMEMTGATKHSGKSLKKVLILFGCAAFLLAGAFTILACADPDGLEWSIAKASPMLDLSSTPPPTAVMPEYNTTFAGIAGATMVMLMLWAISGLLFKTIKK